MSDEEKTKPIFGRRIFLKREMDLLAAAALAISLSTLTLQLRGCVQGPDVRILSPDQVIVMRSDLIQTPRQESSSVRS